MRPWVCRLRVLSGEVELSHPPLCLTASRRAGHGLRLIGTPISGWIPELVEDGVGFGSGSFYFFKGQAPRLRESTYKAIG